MYVYVVCAAGRAILLTPYEQRSELMVPLIYDGSRIYQKLYNMVFDIVYMCSEAAYDGKKGFDL